MPPVVFTALYLLCASLCVGSLELVRRRAPAVSPVVSVQPIERIAVAIPPKPEGVRPVQGVGGERVSEAQCQAYQGQFRDVCMQHLARQKAPTDLPGATDACRGIDGRRERQECLADVAELHAPTDRAAALAICPTIGRRKWRDQCVFGIAMQWSTGDPDFARGACDRAGMWRDFCRHDVNGEVAQVDPQAALDWCNSQLGDGSQLQRKTCFHGLGKYVGRTDPPRALDLCREVPIDDPLYRENCFHGIGWAVAETDSDAALALCTREGGAWEDSCRLGVSAHARRLDPARALALCAGVGRTDLRARCEAFARR